MKNIEEPSRAIALNELLRSIECDNKQHTRRSSLSTTRCHRRWMSRDRHQAPRQRSRQTAPQRHAQNGPGPCDETLDTLLSDPAPTYHRERNCSKVDFQTGATSSRWNAGFTVTSHASPTEKNNANGFFYLRFVYNTKASVPFRSRITPIYCIRRCEYVLQDI